jgi:NAD(P)H-flavin reductase
MAQWKTDAELVVLFGEGWTDELDLSGDDFSIAGRLAMVEQANEWLERNGKELQVADCADAGDEMLWLTV